MRALLIIASAVLCFLLCCIGASVVWFIAALAGAPTY